MANNLNFALNTNSKGSKLRFVYILNQSFKPLQKFKFKTSVKSINVLFTINLPINASESYNIATLPLNNHICSQGNSREELNRRRKEISYVNNSFRLLNKVEFLYVHV